MDHLAGRPHRHFRSIWATPVHFASRLLCAISCSDIFVGSLVLGLERGVEILDIDLILVLSCSAIQITVTKSIARNVRVRIGFEDRKLNGYYSGMLM